MVLLRSRQHVAIRHGRGAHPVIGVQHTVQLSMNFTAHDLGLVVCFESCFVMYMHLRAFNPLQNILLLIKIARHFCLHYVLSSNHQV